MDRKGIMIAGTLTEEGFKGSGKIVAKGTDFEAFPNFLGKNHLRDHRFDTAVPTIPSISIESQPGNGVAYAAGGTITVAVTFSETITITGDPCLELDIGGVTRQAGLQSDAPRSALAQDRDFGDRLVFQYQVAEGDTDSDGIGISANSLKLNGNGIYDSTGNAAELSHNTVAASSDQKVGTSQ